MEQRVSKIIKALLELEGCTNGLPVLFICCVGVVLGLLGSGGGSGLLNGLFLPADCLFVGGSTEQDFLEVS